MQLAFKTLIALILLSVLAGITGSQLAPDVPLLTVLLYCAIGAAVFFVFIVFAAAIGAQSNQFILRNGGSDAAWFWFKGEPPGLEQQRDQLKALKM